MFAAQEEEDATFLLKSFTFTDKTSLQGTTRAPWRDTRHRKHIPDIQRYGHNGVEDDDVGPEGEEAREKGTVYRLVPGQVDLEAHPDLVLPNGIADGQDHPHADQKSENLGRSEKQR